VYSKGSDSQSSTIKSGINTQNIEIRNENAQQARTGKSINETLAAIKTDINTDNAESQSGKLENRFDKNALQKELNVQVEATKGFVQTASAAGNAIANKLGEEAVAKQREAQAAQEVADRAYKANPSKENETALNTANQNLITANNEADKWQTGGEYKRKIDGAMNAISAALGGLPAAGIATSAISPEINHQIKLATEGSPMANKVAHALWGAVEAYSANQNAAAGAGGALAGEVMADVIAKDLYGKKPNQLNREEKEVVSSVSQAAGALIGGVAANSSQGIGVGLTTAKNAVDNNYLSVADVENLIRELSKAQKEGRDTKPILEKYKGISEENRQQLIACNGNVACETAHLHEMNTGAEELERNLGFFSRMTVYYPNDLNTANRIALSNLVESENAESFSKLSDTTKFGLNAMEAGTAIGLGAAAGYAKVGLSNVKSLISGKNKAYPTSGMDGYKRANVGDEDYRSSGAGNAYVDPRTEKLKSVLPTGRQMLDPSEVSFSQATVSYQKKGKGYNYDTMVEDMRKNGWNGKPVDVVNMPDNAPTSMDNTRILAARNAGIKVDAIVHNYSDKLSYEDIRRFGVGNTYPKTWGEAIELRVKKQSSMSGVDKNWSTKFSHGSLYDPKVVK